MRKLAISVFVLAVSTQAWALNTDDLLATIAMPLAVNAVSQRDFPIVQAATIVIAIAFSLINLVVDLLYAVLNPRVQLE